MNKRAQLALLIGALAILALIQRPGEVAPEVPDARPLPQPPAGWRPLTNAELTPRLREAARLILTSGAPEGTMVPVVVDGEKFGGFVTRHGEKRAVEIWTQKDAA